MSTYTITSSKATSDFIAGATRELNTLGEAAYRAGENADVHGAENVRHTVALIRRTANAVRADIDFRNLTVVGEARENLMAIYDDVMSTCSHTWKLAANL